MKSIFIFRRDLRLTDNSGFINALKESAHILPLFIFNSKQIDKKENSFFSDNESFLALQGFN
jgi:deoxyribodipyrimidine photo-lyase